MPANNEVTPPWGEGVTVSKINEKCAEEIYDEIFKKAPKQQSITINIGPCPHIQQPGSGSGGEDNKKDDGKEENGNGKNKNGKCNGGKGGIPGVMCQDCLDKLKQQLGQGRMDIHVQQPTPDPNSPKKEGQPSMPNWGEILINAIVAAQQRGMTPNGAERLVNQVTKPKINWRNIIQKHITSTIPHDLSWQKINKKSISLGMIIAPGTLKENVEVITAVDTSGSISEENLTEFISEIIGISLSYSQVHMTIIAADSEVHEALEVKNGNINKILSWKPKGGGGTSHECIWKWIKENIQKPRLVICFTDGESDMASLDKPPWETVWAISRNGTSRDVKFGRVVDIK